MLALVLGMYLWEAHREVEKSYRVATAERLSRAGNELTSLIGQTQTARQAAFERIVGNPNIRSALAGAAPAAAESTLARLLLNSEGQLPVLLLDASQRVLVRAGTPTPALAQQHLPRSIRDASESDRITYGRIYPEGDRGHFWSTYAIRDGSTLLGYIAQLRMVGNPAAQNPIVGLIGPETTILFANRDDFTGPWVRLDGELQEPPSEPSTIDTAHIHERAGASYLAVSNDLAGTPWMIVLETPESVTKARSAAFLRRTGLFGLALIVIGMLIAWLVSRKFTRPLRELAGAAEGIAAGNYGERVEEAKHNDELGALALAFNHMAGEVQRSMSESEASRAEAELANRVKSEFLANMSHEIRTPINAMLGYADLMDLGISGPITPDQRSQLERIRVSGRHLTGLIEDLLDFARVETGRLAVRQLPATANDAVRTAVTVVEPQATAKQVHLSVRCSGELRYVGDPQRVEQILVNLLGNAIKFTPSGGQVTLDCDSAMSDGEPRTTFAVEDTGVGIEADRLDSIFDAFVQGQSGYTRPHGGSGLGLTISRRLAHLMGGEIHVESTLGRGSRFTLVLPAPAEAEAGV